MKRLSLLLLLVTLTCLGFNSCKKKSTGGGDNNNNNNNNNTETIDVDVPITKTETITDSVPTLPVPIFYPGIPGLMSDTFATNVDQMLLTYAPPGITKDKIVKIVPKSFSVYIDNTTDQNFDFIDDSVHIFIDKYGGTSPVMVAKANGIAKGTKSLEFNVIPTDIKDLFYNDFLEFSLRFGIPANSTLKKNSVFVTNIKFTITAYKN